MDKKYQGKAVMLPKGTAALVERVRDEMKKELGFRPSASNAIAAAVTRWTQKGLGVLPFRRRERKEFAGTPPDQKIFAFYVSMNPPMPTGAWISLPDGRMVHVRIEEIADHDDALDMDTPDGEEFLNTMAL